MNAAEKTLQALLRLVAAAEWLAVIGVFMPARWMAATCAWLGLGGFPDGPIVPYLARSLSAFYVIHGGILWIAARDPRRYAAVIRFVAVSGVCFSILMTALDVLADFPWYWTAAEGPTLTALSIVFLTLLRRVPGR